MYLLTETDDTLITENNTKIIIHPTTLCYWPTVQDVKDYLGITDNTQDAFIQSSIDATSQSIETYLDRKIPLQYQVDTYRKSDFDPGAIVRLKLNRTPVYEIVAVLGDGASVDYVLDDDGIAGHFYNYDEIEIRYYGGYCPIPAEILSVFYQIMGTRWNLRSSVGIQGTGPIKKESIPGVYSVEYYDTKETNSSYDFITPHEYAHSLCPYKTTFI